jgi:AraC-like DNA-binding protein
MMDEVLSRAELLRIIPKFLADENRGISIKLFAELCGVDASHIRKIFITQESPLTEHVQRRVNKAYRHVLDGEVAVMEDRKGHRFVEYRKQPKPRLARSMGLEVQDGRIKIKLGVRNRMDYSGYTLDEQLKGKRNG